MWFIEFLDAIDRALEDRVTRRKLIIRAIEDAIVLVRRCLWTAAVCGLCTLVFRWLGVE